ncbi:MAG: class I SAM-dependent methyltransferase [Deltaproteobacteria bacterium]|nr:class I SAM-dependent methyltransferase [Deltaproteobacteria bacterium]
MSVAKDSSNMEPSYKVSDGADLKGERSDSSDNGELKRVDVAALMLEIRKRIKSDIELHKDKYEAFKGYRADGDKNASRKAGELLHSQDLLFLNRNYQYGYRSKDHHPTSRLPWPLGKIVIWLKRKIIDLREFLLRDYLAAERDFQANLVRYLNDVSKYVDARDFACFWELIRKIDYDVTKALDRIERINDEMSGTMRSSERRIFDEVFSNFKELQGVVTNLQGQGEQHDAVIKRLDSVVLGLESILARQKGTSPVETNPQAADGNAPSIDYSYLLLENRFRGSEEEISRRLAIYPALFKGVQYPVLEIGAGRGELQQLFRNEGVASYGIDLDEAMVQECKSKGLDVRLEEALSHLRSIPDASLGGVIAIQVVEHLTREQLEELFALCRSKVAAPGRIIFETINPQSLHALSSNYFRDPTHVWPLHPDLLAYMMELSGLKVVDVKMLSPVPKEAELRPIPVGEHMTPRWAYTVETINYNIAQLNRLLYGFQDYCIVAEVRA